MEDIVKSESISDYLIWVKEVHNVEYSEYNFSCFQDHVYFRGHASTTWDLVPSLFREQGRIHNEHKMLLHASNLLWSELHECKDDLEKLIRLQHYGLHTRLLDVTFNPLVALFFACHTPSNPTDKKDGVIYCGYMDVEDVNRRIGQAIAKYVFNYNATDIDYKSLNKICEEYRIQKYMLEKAHFIDPPLNNNRILAQSGAFIMSPLLKENAKPPFEYASLTYIKGCMESAFSKKIVIPESSKAMIIQELDYLGFNKATIFTDITNKLQYINEKEDKDWIRIDFS